MRSSTASTPGSAGRGPHATRQMLRALAWWLLLACTLHAAAEVPVRVDAARRVDRAPPAAWIVDEPMPGVRTGTGPDLAGQQFLLVTRQVRVAPDDTQQQYSRVATAVTGSAGLDEAAKVEIEFDPSYQTLHLHHVALVRGGQRMDRLDLARAQVLQRETDLDESMFNGRVSWLLVLQDVRVGDVVDVAYTIDGANPIFGVKFFDGYPLRWSVPAALLTYRVRAPLTRPLRTRTLGLDVAATVRETDGEREYAWVQRDVPAVNAEEGTPDWYVQFAFSQVSEYRDWAEVAAWAMALYRRAEQPPSGALAEQIAHWRAAGVAGREQAVDEVQERVRYFGFEFGANSHLPSDPNETWRDRFGDCKDKSLLLSVILRGLGVDAVPALVATDAQRGIGDMLPSPGVFDHVIVRWRDGDRVRWIDPTATFQRGAIASRYLPDYALALPVAADTRALARIERDAGAAWRAEIDQSLHLADTPGSATLDVDSRYDGAWADSMREDVSAQSLAELQRGYENYYAGVFQQAHAEDSVRVVDDAESNRIALRERYRLPRLDERAIPLFAESIDGFVKLPRDVQRRTPLALPYPVQATHRIRIEHPATMSLTLPEAPLTVENDFVRYSRVVQRTQGAALVTQEYRSKADAVPAARMPEYLDALRRIRDAMFVDAAAVRASTHEQRLARIRALIRGEPPPGASPAPGTGAPAN